jgi:nitroreductase
VPSAGAIFPYTLVVLARGSGSGTWELYQSTWEPSRFTQLAPHTVAAQIANSLGADEADFHVLVMTRAWLSIRKYGPRGYLYTQVDAAHAATNIYGLAREHFDTRVSVRMKVPSRRIEELLSEHLPHHQLQCVVTVKPAREGETVDESGLEAGTQLPIVNIDDRISAVDPLHDYEGRAWSWTDRAFPSADREAPTVSDAPFVGQTSLSVDIPWARLSAARTSAKNFGSSPLSPAAIAKAARFMFTPIKSDLTPAEGPQLGLKLVFCEAPMGIAFASLGLDISSTALSSGVASAGVVESCMGQQHVENAQAFFVIHSSRHDMIGDGTATQLRDSIFRAGTAAHLFHLGATAAGIGVSTIGGFDQDDWRHYSQIDPDRDILYLIAIGSVRDEHIPLERLDREGKAHAHGEQ